jgi:hypothetical protein
LELEGHERRFKVIYANTFDEPVGGLMNVLLTEDGQHHQHTELNGGRSLVIDVGGFTTDWIAVNPGGEVDYSLARSVPIGIPIVEVRGQWQPIVTMAEYEKGLDILHQHDAYKTRNKVHNYLLRGVLWLEVDGKRYKMFGSNPSGYSRSCSYYMTRTKIDDRKIHIPCQVVDEQIPQWLKDIMIDPVKEAIIQKVYQAEIKRVTHDGRDETISGLKRQLVLLKEEESRLGRLLITNKIGDEAYDKLRKE